MEDWEKLEWCSMDTMQGPPGNMVTKYKDHALRIAHVGVALFNGYIDEVLTFTSYTVELLARSMVEEINKYEQPNLPKVIRIRKMNVLPRPWPGLMFDI